MWQFWLVLLCTIEGAFWGALRGRQSALRMIQRATQWRWLSAARSDFSWALPSLRGCAHKIAASRFSPERIQTVPLRAPATMKL